jgi:hypothetical protein
VFHIVPKSFSSINLNRFSVLIQESPPLPFLSPRGRGGGGGDRFMVVTGKKILTLANLILKHGEKVVIISSSKFS